jgi:hypothetical protein
MKREEKKKMIMEWMDNHGVGEWVSPTEIGMEVFGLYSAEASSVASPLCKELAAERLLERSKRGWYRVRL